MLKFFFSDQEISLNLLLFHTHRSCNSSHLGARFRFRTIAYVP